MPIFAVIAPGPSEQLRTSISGHYPKYLEFSPGQFVLATESVTTQQVAQTIGADGSKGKFVVFWVAGHWGYHDKTLWEWMAANAS